ncbi:MAG: hypothetical protein ACPLN1_04625 [Caldisericia bacterium]
MTKKIIILLLSLILILSLISCSNKKELKVHNTLPENREIWLDAIPRPGKRIGINPKMPIRNVKLISPKKKIFNLDIDRNPTITLYETGDYTLTYEYCYEDPYRAIYGTFPENDKEWKSGSLSFSLDNFKLSKPYELKKSKMLTFAMQMPSSPGAKFPSNIEAKTSVPSILYLVKETNEGENEWFLCELNEIKKIKLSLFFNLEPNIKNKIGFRLKDKNSCKIIDEIYIEITLPLIQNNFSYEILEKKEDFLKHVVYFIEDGNVFCYDFINDKLYLLNEGYSIKTISLSPDGSYLAFSSRNASYFSKFNGEEFTKIADYAIEPVFSKNHTDTIFLISSKDRWKFEWSNKAQKYLALAEIYTYSISDKKLKSFGSFNFPVPERYEMYDLDFIFKDFLSLSAIEDLSNISPILFSHPYEKNDLITIKISDYYYKNFIFNGREIKEFTNEVSFPDRKVSIGHIVWKNEPREAIVLGTEIAPYDVIKYVEESSARLGSPSERDEFLAFIRYKGDINPASNIREMQEVYSELCIYNKYLDSLKLLPTEGALYKVLLPFETLY